MSRVDTDIEALRRGEIRAIDAFYREHARLVLRWVIRLGGPWLDAEDVAQDVFVTALRRIDGFRGDARLSTWLFGITRRVVANARRRMAFRRFFSFFDVPEPSTTETPDREIERLQERRQVQLALERMSARDREVLVLVELEERPAQEAAEMLGIPVGTVYSRAHNARRRFAEALAQIGVDPSEISGAPATAGDPL